MRALAKYTLPGHQGQQLKEEARFGDLSSAPTYFFKFFFFYLLGVGGGARE